MARILMVTLGFPPRVGGISTNSYQLAKNMGEGIVVLAPSCKGIQEFDKVQRFATIRMKLISVRLLERPSVFLLFRVYLVASLAFYILFYAVRIRPTKIYVSYWVYALSALPTSKLFRIPYYFEVHGSEILRPMRNRFYRTLLNICAKNARKIICLGSYQKFSLVKEGISVHKLYVAKVGVDLDFFRPDIDPSKIIRKYDLKDRKVILTVGRLVERKGHDMVIKSLPSVLTKIPNAVYLIVGEGPELRNLKNLVEQLDLRENVIFAGYVPNGDLPRYYNACDLFIMASREVNGDVEGFGIVYLEANACGKPVVAGRSGGTRSAVRHGVNGFLVDPLNTEEISEKITLLLTKKKLAQDMGGRGRTLVEERFGYPMVAKNILKIIETT